MGAWGVVHDSCKAEAVAVPPCAVGPLSRLHTVLVPAVVLEQLMYADQSGLHCDRNSSPKCLSH